MDRRLSVYLDLLRFAMAVVVMLSHYSSERLSGGLFWHFEGYGSQAVMVFFVLSGFVIAYTAESKDRGPSGFIKSRFARLYSVVVPAIVLALVVDAIGRNVDPSLYTMAWNYSPDHWIGRSFLCLTFLTQAWGHDIRAFSDLPFWSLGYEFWYYIMFAALFYVAGRRRIAAFAVVALIVGPAVLMLFPIWWMGVWTYRWSRTHSVPRALGWCLFTGSIISFVWIRHSRLNALLDTYFQSAIYVTLGENYFPPTPNIVYDYLIGLLAVCNIIGFSAISDVVSAPLMRWQRPIVYFAGLTFSLYLYHMPLMQVFAALYGGAPSAWGRRVFILVATLVCAWALGSVTERKKHVARAIVEKLEWYAKMAYWRVTAHRGALN